MSKWRNGYNEFEEYVVGVETKTNKIYNGKPVYRKVIFISASDQNIDISALNIDAPLCMYGYFTKYGGNVNVSIFPDGSSACVPYFTRSQVRVASGSAGYAYSDIYAVIEYTKTTD